MSDSTCVGGSRFGAFLAGLGIGAVVALLFAPRSGKETRELITQKAEEGKEQAVARGKELRQQAEEYVGKARDVVARQKEQLSAALDAGKQAYQSAKTKTEQ